MTRFSRKQTLQNHRQPPEVYLKVTIKGENKEIAAERMTDIHRDEPVSMRRSPETVFHPSEDFARKNKRPRTPRPLSGPLEQNNTNAAPGSFQRLNQPIEELGPSRARRTKAPNPLGSQRESEPFLCFETLASSLPSRLRGCHGQQTKTPRLPRAHMRICSFRATRTLPRPIDGMASRMQRARRGAGLPGGLGLQDSGGGTEEFCRCDGSNYELSGSNPDERWVGENLGSEKFACCGQCLSIRTVTFHCAR